MKTSVALFAFNRVETLARVFAVVRAARPPRLFLVCDGPRVGREGEAARCAQVRALLEQVDWPCDVERNYADDNMGCRWRVSSGIDWVFSRTEEAIFLEDDTLVDASFFPFAEELLARYADDERVLMISAYNALGRGTRGRARASYWFSAHPRIWGWASWRRAWQGYDVTMADWPAAKATPAWTMRTREEKAAWGAFLDDVQQGKVDTWDAQVSLHAWRTGRLSVIPAVNLVTNIGFGAGSTNTAAARFPGPAVRAMAWPLVHPSRVTPSPRLDAAWVRRENAPRGSRVRRLARRVFNWVRGR